MCLCVCVCVQIHIDLKVISFEPSTLQILGNTGKTETKDGFESMSFSVLYKFLVYPLSTISIVEH